MELPPEGKRFADFLVKIPVFLSRRCACTGKWVTAVACTTCRVNCSVIAGIAKSEISVRAKVRNSADLTVAGVVIGSLELHLLKRNSMFVTR